MKPYYASWSVGGHKDVACVACHVDPGTVANAKHKVAALKEVYDHVAGDPRFLRGDSSVPDSRCLACHTSLPAVTKSGFQHSLHIGQSTCVSCHATAGHQVSLESLKAAGVLAQVATWAFTHPASTTCETCHTPPANHHTGFPCTTCHTKTVAFAKTVFTHPASGACSSCHKPPSGHRTSNCYSCHKRPGKSWAFTHPSSSACSSCHKAPASHFGTTCSQCHSPSRAWTSANFNHPSTHHDWRSMACSNCHPKGPPAVGCTCHGGSPNGPGGD